MIQYRVATTQQRVRTQTDGERDAVWDRRVGRLKRRAWRRRLLNAFLVWQIFAVTVWLLPARWALVRAALPADGGGAVRAYMTATCMIQGWGMYTPKPADQDVGMEVRLAYKDGTHRTWFAPRVKDMGYVAKYRWERMRKWVEVGSNDMLVWMPLARYAARRCGIDPHNPPVGAVLIEHLQALPPPGKPAPPARTVPLCRVRFSPWDLQ